MPNDPLPIDPDAAPLGAEAKLHKKHRAATRYNIKSWGSEDDQQEDRPRSYTINVEIRTNIVPAVIREWTDQHELVKRQAED